VFYREVGRRAYDLQSETFHPFLSMQPPRGAVLDRKNARRRRGGCGDPADVLA
jgi:hypothetical protein